MSRIFNRVLRGPKIAIFYLQQSDLSTHVNSAVMFSSKKHLTMVVVPGIWCGAVWKRIGADNF